VAGMVASVRYLFTRERAPFASAILEDLDGRIEVMVWPRVYANTRELWEEGNILLVEGKVRLRDDRVQLNCDIVRRYQPEAAPAEETAAVKPGEVPVVTEEAPVQSRRLILTITQSGDEASDIAYLHKLIDTLRGFPGQDEVNLRVISEEKVIKLKLSNMYANYCPELHQRLVELVGEEGIGLEPNA
jgi:DNA polymerase-3 subunit alpha